jgi:hypothetical protein
MVTGDQFNWGQLIIIHPNKQQHRQQNQQSRPGALSQTTIRLVIMFVV